MAQVGSDKVRLVNYFPRISAWSIISLCSGIAAFLMRSLLKEDLASAFLGFWVILNLVTAVVFFIDWFRQKSDSNGSSRRKHEN